MKKPIGLAADSIPPPVTNAQVNDKLSAASATPRSGRACGVTRSYLDDIEVHRGGRDDVRAKKERLAVTLTWSFVAMAQLAQAALKEDLWWAVTF